MYGRRLVPRMGSYTPRVSGAGGFTNPSQQAVRQWGWSFHTVRGDIDPEDHHFCVFPQFVVAHVWMDF